jgi:hypothetical protein
VDRNFRIRMAGHVSSQNVTSMMLIGVAPPSGHHDTPPQESSGGPTLTQRSFINRPTRSVCVRCSVPSFSGERERDE